MRRTVGLVFFAVLPALACANGASDGDVPTGQAPPSTLDAGIDAQKDAATTRDSSVPTLDAGDIPPPPDAATPDDASPTDAAADVTATPDTGTVDAAPDTGATNACAQALAGLTFDFESGDQKWTHTFLDNGVAGDDEWAVGTPTSGPNAAHGGTSCWGTYLAGNYAQCTRSALASPTLDLSACTQSTVKLSFWHWYAFWTGSVSGATYADGGVVELSSDGGKTWAAAPGLPTTGTIAIAYTNGTAACDLTSGFHVDGLAGFTGTSGGWKRVEITVPKAYLTAAFQVRFAFGNGVSSPSTTRTKASAGWYVDDVALAAAP